MKEHYFRWQGGTRSDAAKVLTVIIFPAIQGDDRDAGKY